eukprot:CAMPEP_0168399716 /NCGR_PEP_ID=MMETSP0228-20121227/22230_1 /TAXON_ID=133427 /ORGANISM="Protoceratium reticulatum, Strain CCCM 535 (=CCMP 1889)" /LENGTH=405 /DNA_ID=CAMNT_0008413243 /DNA_START=30 /DNA_END=1247 /DNA_ORIENTATION=+
MSGLQPMLHRRLQRRRPRALACLAVATLGTALCCLGGGARAYMEAALPSGRPPSERQLRLASRLAERAGAALPEDVAQDAGLLSNFIDMQQSVLGESAFGPSEAQLKFASKIAEAAGLQVPEEALQDSRRCSEFIDAHIDRLPNDPSKKQLNFARKLAEEAYMEVPEAALRDRKACSAFIDERLEAAKSGRTWSNGPSEKQFDFAERPAQEALNDRESAKTFIDERQLAKAKRLAETNGVFVPPRLLSDKEGLQEFIQEQEGVDRRFARGPSERQLEFAEDLARQRGIKVPEEALSDSKACSSFIDGLKQDRFSPTARQLGYAKGLARGQGIEVPVEALGDKKACSRFIEDMLQGRGFPNTQAAARDPRPAREPADWSGSEEAKHVDRSVDTFMQRREALEKDQA